MAHLILHAITHSLEDVIKSAPILLIVYAVLYWMEHKMRAAPTLMEKAQKVGPVIGALAGSVPQCGFSAAASALFAEGFLAPATLVAVFLATSDEAIPLMLSGGATGKAILLLVVKIVLAIVGGYVLQWTIFRRAKRDAKPPVHMDISHHGDHCCGSSLFSAIILRTVQTCLFLLGIMVVINLAVELVGEDAISSFLLGGSFLQPVLCACIGLIPSCAISVLLSQLYLSGAIGFGGLVAGLSTGAGFGYMILLREKSSRSRALPVITATWVVAVIGGIVCQLIWN
ncbi:MAG: putative manganese transporter [Butyricicoccus sp.]|nr:putative manganese transporter [Butyricicoccus sp.]